MRCIIAHSYADERSSASSTYKAVQRQIAKTRGAKTPDHGWSHFSRFCSKALVVPVHVFLGRQNDMSVCLTRLCLVWPRRAPRSQTLPTERRGSARSAVAVHRRGASGRVALYAHNLKTGQTASISPDEPVKTASTIKMGILLDAAEQIRAGNASFDEKLVLTKENQVQGSGVLGQLTAPLTLTLRDVLHLMVVLSDNTATNVAIDRLGLAHINATLAPPG